VVECFEDEREWDSAPGRTTGNRLHDLGNIEAVARNGILEGVFIVTNSEHLCFGLFAGSKLGKSGERLTTHGSADFEVVTQNSFVRRRRGHRYLGRGIGAADLDDGGALVFNAKNAEETVDFTVGVGGPDGEMVPGLIAETRTLERHFHMEAIALSGGEYLPRSDDGSDVRIVGGIGAFRSRQMLLGGLAKIDCGILRTQIQLLLDFKDRLVSTTLLG